MKRQREKKSVVAELPPIKLKFRDVRLESWYIHDVHKKHTKACVDARHNTHGSPFPKQSVPMILFKDNQKEFKTCLHCRVYDRERTTKQRKVRQQNVPDGYKWCGNCKGAKLEINFVDKNTCVDCRLWRIDYKNKIRNLRSALKFDLFKKFGYSCQHCKKIFLKPVDQSGVHSVQTYLIGDDRYVKYNDAHYKVSDFYEQFEDRIEYRIIDFDHLTCNEQMQRGIIVSEDEYEPKIDSLANLATEEALIREAKKCQILCIDCHILITIQRNGGIGGEETWGTKLGKQKRVYLDHMKSTSSGCQLCRRVMSLPRLYDMDHIDPKQKSFTITQAVNSDKISFQEFVDECKKCRLLCKFCHRIHTYETQQNEREEKLAVEIRIYKERNLNI